VRAVRIAKGLGILNVRGGISLTGSGVPSLHLSLRSESGIFELYSSHHVFLFDIFRSA
jgi:hypothetical protein